MYEHRNPASPIALWRDKGDAIWFLGVLATIKASKETSDGRVAVIEHLAPQGAGSPQLGATATEFGIEILDPPGIPS